MRCPKGPLEKIKTSYQILATVQNGRFANIEKTILITWQKGALED